MLKQSHPQLFPANLFPSTQGEALKVSISTSHLSPPPKPEERAGRHQRPWIQLPAANKTYLSHPACSPCPPLRGDKPAGPPEHARAAAQRDRVTRWTWGSHRSPLRGSLLPPEPAEL